MRRVGGAACHWKLRLERGVGGGHQAPRSPPPGGAPPPNRSIKAHAHAGSVAQPPAPRRRPAAIAPSAGRLRLARGFHRRRRRLAALCRELQSGKRLTEAGAQRDRSPRRREWDGRSSLGGPAREAARWWGVRGKTGGDFGERTKTELRHETFCVVCSFVSCLVFPRPMRCPSSRLLRLFSLELPASYTGVRGDRQLL